MFGRATITLRWALAHILVVLIIQHTHTHIPTNDELYAMESIKYTIKL